MLVSVSIVLCLHNYYKCSYYVKGLPIYPYYGGGILIVIVVRYHGMQTKNDYIQS